MKKSNIAFQLIHEFQKDHDNRKRNNRSPIIYYLYNSKTGEGFMTDAPRSDLYYRMGYGNDYDDLYETLNAGFEDGWVLIYTDGLDKFLFTGIENYIYDTVKTFYEKGRFGVDHGFKSNRDVRIRLDFAPLRDPDGLPPTTATIDGIKNIVQYIKTKKISPRKIHENDKSMGLIIGSDSRDVKLMKNTKAKGGKKPINRKKTSIPAARKGNQHGSEFTKDVKEMASGSATSAGSIASAPMKPINRKNRKKKKYTIKELFNIFNETINSNSKTITPLQVYSEILWRSMLHNNKNSYNSIKNLHHHMNEGQRKWFKENLDSVKILAHIFDQKSSLYENIAHGSKSSEEMKTPPVKKIKSSSKGSMKPNTNNKSKNKDNVGKVTRVPDSYLNKNPVTIAKIIEDAKSLQEFLGDKLKILFF